jgi:hypothetical protein
MTWASDLPEIRRFLKGMPDAERNEGLGAIEERVSPLDRAIKDAMRVLGDEQAFVISIGSARAGGGLHE